MKVKNLLRRVATVAASGAEKFVAKDHLKEANVGWMGENFKRLFFDKVEENVGEAHLVAYNLERNSLDAPILAELGDRAETSLAHMFNLIKKQSKGQSGVLLTSGYANIFYVCGTDDSIWAVRAHWLSGVRYWHVGACSVGSLPEWYSGYRVFSRDS